MFTGPVSSINIEHSAIKLSWFTFSAVVACGLSLFGHPE